MKYLTPAILIIMLTSCGGRQASNGLEKPLTKPTGADIVIYNANIWTGTSAVFKSSVVLNGEKIIFVGNDSEAEQYSGSKTRMINGGGRLVVPGFIDSHTHFISGGFQLGSVNLREAFSREEFREIISNKAASLPVDSWITGGDWDHQQFPDESLPRTDWIDDVTADIFVFVTRHDGHMGVANSRALDLAGISKETPDPEGGIIVRDPETREPTGVLKDAAMDLIWRVIPEKTIEERMEAAVAAMRHAAGLGVTTVHDMGEWADIEAFMNLEKESKLTLRVRFYAPIARLNEVLNAERTDFPSSPLLKLTGFKAFVDGSLGSSTAFFFEPFSDNPDNFGLLDQQMFPPGRMKNRIFKADSAGWQLAVHAIGDRANSMLLDIYEEVITLNGRNDRRFRIEHAQHLRPGDFSRFSASGVIASVQPYHAIDDGRWAIKKIGQERGKTTYAFRTFLDSGVRLAFGSDWTVAPLSPLRGIYAAVTRSTTDGENPDG